jgi:hypothetical protein
MKVKIGETEDDGRSLWKLGVKVNEVVHLLT